MSLTYEMDLTENTDFETIDAGGKGVLPGWYHCVIDSVELEDDGKHNPAIKFNLAILAGEKPAEIGKKHTERLYLTKANKKRQAIFAKRLGLIKPEHAGKFVTVDWDECIGKQVCCQVEEEDYTDKDGKKKKSSKVAYAGIYDVADEKVKDVPKDQESLAIAGSATKTNGTADKFADL